MECWNSEFEIISNKILDEVCGVSQAETSGYNRKKQGKIELALLFKTVWTVRLLVGQRCSASNYAGYSICRNCCVGRICINHAGFDDEETSRSRRRNS